MIIVIDANVLLRYADMTAPLRPVARAALDGLKAQGFPPRSLPQTIYEFWSVATRPLPVNGLGLSVPECDRVVTGLERLFPVLPDAPGLFTEWRFLAVAQGCLGKVAHDARYVAAMRAHGLTHLLTFNVSDFSRFSGLTVLDPAAVAAGTSPGTP